MKIQKTKLQKGFTLVEIVVAIGLVALLLSGVMGLMGVSASRIDKSLAKKEGAWVIDAIRDEFSVVRNPSVTGGYDAGRSGSYTSPYTKALYWLQQSNGSEVIVYKTNVSLTDKTNEGRGLPVDISGGVAAGLGFTEEYRVRLLDSSGGSIAASTDEAEEGFRAGDAYLVKFRPYTRNTAGDLTLGTYAEIASFVPEGNALVTDGYLINVQAEVYQLRNLTINAGVPATNRALTDFQDERGSIRPIFVTNLSFRR